MRTRLLMSVAAASLAVGTAFVMAEPSDKGGKGGQAPSTQAPEGQPGGKGAEPKTTTQPKDDVQPKGKDKDKAAQPKTKDGGAKDTQAQPGAKEDRPATKDKDKDRPVAKDKDKDRPATKDKATTDKPAPSPKDKATTDKGAPTTKDKAATGKNGTGKGAGQPSAQQRTEIRQTIIKQGNAPRVTNVNFNVSIGTTVPRDVRFAVLPPRVIEIYPQWRGYRYFIVEDRIIIIDDNFVIVFIIEA